LPTRRHALSASSWLQNGYYDDREVWVPVVGFDGCEISDRGRVRDARTHTAVKATPK
jgi:hypothetical protein